MSARVTPDGYVRHGEECVGRVYPTTNGWQSMRLDARFVSRFHRTRTAAIRDLLGDSGISPDEYEP